MVVANHSLLLAMARSFILAVSSLIPFSTVCRLHIFHLPYSFLRSDTFSNLTLVGATTSYNFSQSGIAWPGEAQKYSATTSYNLSDIVPPPNWALRYPDNYTSANFPNLQVDEHFQNWMRTAGLPTFSKLYGRNDNDPLVKGTYQLVIGLSMFALSISGRNSRSPRRFPRAAV
jgi:hypothetical protein